MILYPAIDLKGGQCVRLERGDMDRVTVYNPDPAAQGQSFVSQGCDWLHIVDLDGALAGESVNQVSIQKILKTCPNVKIQLGGGIRSIKAIAAWIEAGVSRVILGTAALYQPELVFEACRQFEGFIAVGLDARDGYVATEGWYEKSNVTALELAQKLADAGVSAVIFTDIARDGMKTGVNVAATAALAEAIPMPVIASGGVADLQDLKDLQVQADKGIAGVIAGRALYDNVFTVQEALETLERC